MALTVGAKAPDFTLYDTDKKLRKLSEFLGKKTVLAFYPGAFTGVCTKEMCALRDSLAELNSINAQVVGISIDSPFANKAFSDLNKLSFPLLSDFNREATQKYGGIQVDFAGLIGYMAAKRAIFVLDPKGIVRYTWVSDVPGVEPPYDEIKKAVNAV